MEGVGGASRKGRVVTGGGGRWGTCCRQTLCVRRAPRLRSAITLSAPRFRVSWRNMEEGKGGQASLRPPRRPRRYGLPVDAFVAASLSLTAAWMSWSTPPRGGRREIRRPGHSRGERSAFGRCDRSNPDVPRGTTGCRRWRRRHRPTSRAPTGTGSTRQRDQLPVPRHLSHRLGSDPRPHHHAGPGLAPE